MTRPSQGVQGEGKAPGAPQITQLTLPASILPVMDLRHGVVVRAVAGQREQYKSLQTDWLPDACNLFTLTHAVRNRWNRHEWYVADLDAIEGRSAQRLLIEQLLAEGIQLWLDVGITSIQDINDWLSLPLARLILGSESLQTDFWADTLPHYSQRHRLAFSLDMMRGQPRRKPGLFSSDHHMDIIEEVYRWGIRTVIVLDVADVGTGQGCSSRDLCQQLHHQWPDLQLVAGGGIRSEAEIHSLEEAGVSRILVSTWLHQFATTNAR